MLEPDGPVKISLIIISKNERQYLRHTVDHLRLPKTIPCEVIVVDDGSQDNSTRFLETGDYKKIRTIRTSGIGPNGARVLGVEASKGEILLFLDAHVIPEKNWLEAMAARFDDPGIFALAPVLGSFKAGRPDVYGLNLNQKLQPCWSGRAVATFSPVPMAGAGCLAIRREAYLAVGGFDDGFKGIGYADMDLCLRLWTFGFNIYLDPDIRVMHKFRKAKPYQVVPQDVTYNFLRLAFKNFNEKRITRVINAVKDVPDFGRALIALFNSDAWAQRLALRSKRKHDDDWFFDRFSLD